MKMNRYSDAVGNTWMDCNLLEIAYLQFCCDKCDFLKQAMFAEVDLLDYICNNYDYTDEQPDSELHYTTYQKIDRISRYQMIEGDEYIVMLDALDNIAIYKKLEGEVKND